MSLTLSYFSNNVLVAKLDATLYSVTRQSLHCNFSAYFNNLNVKSNESFGYASNSLSI